MFDTSLRSTARRWLPALCAACGFGAATVQAQTAWAPQRPVTLVVPYNPGAAPTPPRAPSRAACRCCGSSRCWSRTSAAPTA